MMTEYPLLFAEENLDQLRVISVDGQIVAHVGILVRDILILGCRVRSAAIGSVCTHPDFRGQGLASDLMADARRHAVDQGASLMLISGTRGLYRRLGYAEVGAFRRLMFQATLTRQTGCIASFRPGDLDTAIRLHQQEPVRFLRTREDWDRLLSAGMIMNLPATMYRLCQDHEMVAYLAVRQPRNADALPEVAEFGGSRAAMIQTLPQLAGMTGVPAVSVVVRADDPGWSLPLESSPYTSTPIPFDGTVGVLDVERFLGAVRPILTERVAGLEFEVESNGLTVRYGQNVYHLESSAQATGLFFGEDAEVARSVPPCPPAVREALSRALPIPLPWYGFNYV